MLTLSETFPAPDKNAIPVAPVEEYWHWPAADGERPVEVFVARTAFEEAFGVTPSPEALRSYRARIELAARRKQAALPAGTDVFLDAGDLRRPVSVFKVVGAFHTDPEATVGPALRADEALAVYNATHANRLDFASEDDGASDFYLVEAEGVPMAGGWTPGRELNYYALRHRRVARA